MRSFQLSAFSLQLLALAAGPAHACAACYGDPSSSATQGMNMGILFMVGVTVTVLGGFVGAFLVYSRRLESATTSMPEEQRP